jgi:cell wall-associated NlpC family hydrolase
MYGVAALVLILTLATCIKTIEVIEKETDISVIEEKNLIDVVISYAASKVCEPYTWGGDWKQFKYDCSSLIQGAYAQIGVYLPRTAYEQFKYLDNNVSIDEIKKGDLIFYLTDKSRNLPVTHVVLYIGNGRVIEAKNKKLGVIISNFTTKNLIGIKRVIEE